MKKNILILNTGGTLSSVAKENGLTPGLHAGDLEEQIRLVAGGAKLTIIDLLQVDSANIFPEDWALLAQRIRDSRYTYEGVVIIHGTDTLAYTSSMLSFMLQGIEIPVVITGSQMSIAEPVTDAMENLRCAINMAQSGRPGVFVAFNRKIILGCRASKVRSVSFDAFESINAPCLGQISAMGLEFNEYAFPELKSPFELRNRYSKEVGIVKMFPGVHRSVLKMYAEKGYQAIYIEAYGLGGMPFLNHDFIASVKELVDQGIVVLVGTQCRFEGSKMNIYETGIRALEAGVYQAFDMTTEAAITKLMWVLGQTQDPEEIKKYLTTNLCGEVTME